MLSRSKVLPFGERLLNPGGSAPASLRRFTNHEEDHDSNAIYMQARTYLPAYGKFAQVDPAYDQTKDDPETWNLYNYVTNNPVTHTDPDGREAQDAVAPENSGAAPETSDTNGSQGDSKGGAEDTKATVKSVNLVTKGGLYLEVVLSNGKSYRVAIAAALWQGVKAQFTQAAMQLPQTNSNNFRIASDPTLIQFNGPVANQCYDFVRAMRPDLPRSRNLVMGINVYDNMNSIPQWTIIATSIDGLTYPPGNDPKHIGLFGGPGDGGFWMFDQIHRQGESMTPSMRWISYRGVYGVNNAGSYYTVGW